MTYNVFSGTLNPTQSINQLLMITSSRVHEVNGMLFQWSWTRNHEFTSSVECSIRCVHPYIRLSVRPQKSFSDFNLIRCVGRPQPYAHQSDLDLIQDQGHWASEVLKKIALFWVYLLCHFGMELKTDGWLR